MTNSIHQVRSHGGSGADASVALSLGIAQSLIGLAMFVRVPFSQIHRVWLLSLIDEQQRKRS